MTNRITLSISMLALSAAVLAACKGPVDAGGDRSRMPHGDVRAAAAAANDKPDYPGARLWDTSEAYVEHLMSKAQELAERELGRMAAAELTYRNKVELHTYDLPFLTPPPTNFLKSYRSFTGYEIEDIYRSESFLYPVAYQIRFNFDFLRTQLRSNQEPNAKKLAEADTEFTVQGEYSLVRRYRADRNGDYVGNLPDLPPRPDPYDPGKTAPEAGAAAPNRLPPGGPPGMQEIPIPPTLQTLPPISGQTF